MFFEQTFVIYHDSGETIIVDDLCKYISDHGGIINFHSRMKFNLGSYQKNKFYGYSGWYTSSPISDNHYGFYLCNERGLMISPDLLYAEYQKINAYNNSLYYKRRYLSRRMNTAGNRHTTRHDKRPKNQQARRIAAGVVTEEGEPPFRGARSHKIIRTHWDDINVRTSCSWKNCTKRKRQYKGS